MTYSYNNIKPAIFIMLIPVI